MKLKSKYRILECLIFMVTKQIIQKYIMGEIIPTNSNKISNQDVFEALNNFDYDAAILDIQINDICAMPNGYFVSCNQNSIMILGNYILKSIL